MSNFTAPIPFLTISNKKEKDEKKKIKRKKQKKKKKSLLIFWNLLAALLSPKHTVECDGNSWNRKYLKPTTTVKRLLTSKQIKKNK